MNVSRLLSLPANVLYVESIVSADETIFGKIHLDPLNGFF